MHTSAAGFTLIELLVALLIGSLIISSLLFVLVRFLDADRRERAKVMTQEELQAALNFIADDLQEAVYIYDADGIERDSTQTPPGIRDQLPHVTNPSSDICPGPTGSPAARRCTPVLVFWKRHMHLADEPISSSDSRLAGCLEFKNQTQPPGCGTPPRGTDKFTYSLVAYYISRGETDNVPVSTARLLRWELKGGVPWSCAEDPSPTAFTNAAKCPIGPGQRVDRNGNNVTTPSLTTPIVSSVYPDLRDSTIYTVRPDRGFVSPTSVIASTFGTLGQRMNQWRRFADYNLSTNPYTVVLDYLDDTAYNPVHD
ncbi:MAG: prepilin-type N-terminal cleavage/methylation domain-containing protein, partial [Pseudanabaenaceae cyanobacterium]